MDVSQIFIFLNKNSVRYLEENVRHFETLSIISILLAKC